MSTCPFHIFYKYQAVQCQQITKTALSGQERAKMPFISGSYMGHVHVPAQYMDCIPYTVSRVCEICLAMTDPFHMYD